MFVHRSFNYLFISIIFIIINNWIIIASALNKNLSDLNRQYHDFFFKYLVYKLALKANEKDAAL